MSEPQKPDRRLPSAESQKQQAAASRETSRPADSVPVVAGQFAHFPATFGRYRVEKLLGRGAMGAVYLARDTQLDRPVALKIPKVAASGSKRLLLRLETEAKAAAQLDHPSLCKVYDAGEINGQCFIAMQYIEGETLKTQLEAKSKSVAEAVSLIVQLARGLSEAHALGIIHRDLKPENIMINRRGTPVVMDFGLARFSTISSNAKATQAGTILGSPAYMSPEQASGNTQEIDQRSDIYALGVILFEMLTGELPFGGSAMQILGQKSILDPVSPLSLKPSLPPAVAAMCHKMIARKNADRYQTLSAVIDELQKTAAIGTVPLPASLVDQTPAAFPDFSSIVYTDEGNAFTTKSRKKKTPNGLSAGSGAIATIPQRLLAWGKGQPPVVKWTALGGAGALLVALGIILFYPTRYGVVKIDIGDPSLSVRFDDDTITVDNDGKPISIAPTAKKTLRVFQNAVAIESATQEVTIKRGDTRLITLNLVGDEVVLDGKPISSKSTVATKADNSGWQGWPADAPPPAIAPFDAEQARKHQAAWAAYLKVPVAYQNSIGMKFRLIPPGEYTRGSTDAEVQTALPVRADNEQWRIAINSESPAHRTIITQPFFLGAHEVTQKEYEQLTQNNPSFFCEKGGGKVAVAGHDTATFPAENIEWNEAVEFCATLSRKEDLQPIRLGNDAPVAAPTGNGYRLPTEAEWEMACRAGTTSSRWIGNDDALLSHLGWFATNSGNRTHAVGEMSPNPFGLTDMFGNVLEWTADGCDPQSYQKYLNQPAVDPRIPSGSGGCYLRGGSYQFEAAWSRAAFRTGDFVNIKRANNGFRVLLTIAGVRHTLEQRQPDSDNSPASNAGKVSAPPQISTTPQTVTEEQLRQRIETAWPGLGNRLSKDGAGNYALHLRACPQVTDLTPLQGMPLSTLNITYNGQLSDLTPLQGMKLKSLWIGRCGNIKDLRPLQGMELDYLNLDQCNGLDLTQLKGMKIKLLSIWNRANNQTQFLPDIQTSGLILSYSHIDLLPLKRMTLTELQIDHCVGFADLTALKDLPLTKLNIIGCDQIQDITPLKDMPLIDFKCDFKPERDSQILRAIKTLKTINEKPAKEFWKLIDDAAEVKSNGTSATSSVSPAIPGDAEKFRTKRFKLFEEALSWKEARKKCRELGGRLAEVSDGVENNFLKNMAIKSKVEGVWLGATDEVTESRWLWNTGAEFKYTNWSLEGKQPNNKGEGEHYLLMMLKLAPGEWCDQPERSVEWKTGFICEWDAAAITKKSADKAWKSVFNGKNLTGWTPMLIGKSDVAPHQPTFKGWIVRYGELICDTNEHGWLKLNQSYGDCEIDFEFFLPPETNSGLVVRCPTDTTLFRASQCEVQLVNSTAQIRPEQRCGGIWGLIGPSKMPFKPGEWNHMNVRLLAGQLSVHFNDQLTVDARIADYPKLNDLPKRGNFGLFNTAGQAKGCRFRRIRIKELKP